MQRYRSQLQNVQRFFREKIAEPLDQKPGDLIFGELHPELANTDEAPLRGCCNKLIDWLNRTACR
jgi:hypothetical protein